MISVGLLNPQEQDSLLRIKIPFQMDLKLVLEKEGSHYRGARNKD
jgi:hypothetical protein